MRNGPQDAEGAGAAEGSRAEIVLRIDRAVHDPFRALWTRWREEAWREIRGVFGDAARAHAEALETLRAGQPTPNRAEAKPTGAGEDPADTIAEANPAERYRRRVVAAVLEPLTGTLRAAKIATELEEALATAADEAAERIGRLPRLMEAPLEDDAPLRARDGSRAVAARAFVARALPPALRPRGSRTLPVCALAWRHLARAVQPHQQESFRALQRLRIAWLHDLERAWAEWSAAALTAGAEAEGGIIEAGQRLQRMLAILEAESAGIGDPGPHLHFDALRKRLGAEVAVAGSWIGARASADGTSWRRQGAEAMRWDRLARESGARLELCLALLRLEIAALGAAQMLGELWEEAAGEILGHLDEIRTALRAGQARLAEEDNRSDDPGGRIAAEGVRMSGEIRALEEALGDPAQLLERFRKGIESALHRTEEACAQLPGTLVLHRVPDPGRAGEAVPLGEIATGAFDPLWRNRLEEIAALVPESMRRVLTIVAELREVAAYGYEAALEEIAEVNGTGPSAGMASDGLDRAGVLAVRARTILDEALRGATAAVRREFATAVAAIEARATADPLHARWLALRSGTGARAARGRRWLRDRIRGVAGLGAGMGKGVRRRLWPVRQILGIGSARTSRTALRDRSLREPEAALASLPVLYRRLFSFNPVTDPRLLAGRDPALQMLVASGERWREERSGSVMVVGQPGAGTTSFLNIAADALGRTPARGIRRAIEAPCREEAELARIFGGWFDIGDAADLDALADALLATEKGRLPDFAIVEGLEQLHLRVAGGAHLFERTMEFAARTRSRLFWVLSMTASAWQLIGKRSPACVAELEPIELAELGADDLRQVILARHRLSGIPLQYLEAGGRRQRLMRKLRRLVNRRQGRLAAESAYFQRLHRTSHGSVRNALLHWLHSADFRSIEGTLLVHPLDPPAISLAGLNTDHRFALKALLDHGALNISEYAAIARREESEIRHRFRTLQELNLIEASGEGDAVGGGAARASEDKAASAAGVGNAVSAVAGTGTRYRIRPFMVGEVTSHLRAANILH